jgi:heat shock protein beta
MKDWQTEIYVFPGENIKTLEESSFMDTFNDKDIEVLYLTEAIDEFWLAHAREFDGKKYRDITKEGVKFSDEDEDLAKRRNKVYTDKFKPLTKYLKKLFGSNVSKVSISKRLGKAPAIVSASEWGNSANMDRLQRAQAFNHAPDAGHMPPTGNLELNPRHPFVIKLLESLPEEEDAEVPSSVKDAAWMLFDTATMSGGFPIRDPKQYATRMTRILKSNLGVESLALADEIDPPVEEEEPEEPEFNVDDINLDDFEAVNIGDDSASD